MSINLNDSTFEGSRTFNDGKAGLVENVTIKVDKKSVDQPDTYPDYNLTIVDENGGELREGFYNFEPQKDLPMDQVERKKRFFIMRLVHIARAVMGDDYQLPEVKDTKEAMDVVFKLVRDNAGAKKFNVFTTYGSVGYPNKKGYLKLRYFDFIEDAAGENTLVRKAQDLMEPVVADEPETTSSSEVSGWSAS